jgi:Icc-related predicted phosphoesterase
MKATHITQDGKKVSKMKVVFLVSNEDIILAIDKLTSFGEKITKKNIEQQIQSKFLSIGVYDDTEYNNYEEALELAMKLYPDYF